MSDADEEDGQGDVTWASASSLKALTRESSFSFSSAHWGGKVGGRGGEDRVRIPGVWHGALADKRLELLVVLVCAPKCVSIDNFAAETCEWQHLKLLFLVKGVR